MCPGIPFLENSVLHTGHFYCSYVWVIAVRLDRNTRPTIHYRATHSMLRSETLTFHTFDPQLYKDIVEAIELGHSITFQTLSQIYMYKPNRGRTNVH